MNLKGNRENYHHNTIFFVSSLAFYGAHQKIRRPKISLRFAQQKGRVILPQKKNYHLSQPPTGAYWL